MAKKRYSCPKCKKKHFYNSKIGRKHATFSIWKKGYTKKQFKKTFGKSK